MAWTQKRYITSNQSVPGLIHPTILLLLPIMLLLYLHQLNFIVVWTFSTNLSHLNTATYIDIFTLTEQPEFGTLFSEWTLIGCNLVSTEKAGLNPHWDYILYWVLQARRSLLLVSCASMFSIYTSSVYIIIIYI